MIYAITPVYTFPSTLAWSLMRFHETAGTPFVEFRIVDNYWPMMDPVQRKSLLELVSLLQLGQYLIPPGEKNIGGHGAYNFALSKLDLKEGDQVLCYDPDSNPVTPGWLDAMSEVLKTNETLGAVSLMPAWLLNRRDWNTQNLNGIRVAHHSKPDMWNVTLFKASTLMKTKGLLADTRYYGHVERAMYREFVKHGLWHGYLYDYREEPCPIPHPKKYQDWKGLHSSGLYLKNFDDYLKENPQ